MRVGRLLSRERSYQPGDATDFYFHDVVNSFSGDCTVREWFLSLWKDEKVYKAWLWCGRNQ